MVLSRRALLPVLAACALPLDSGASRAAGWKDQYKKLRFGIASVENAQDGIARMQGVLAYLTKRLGVPVEILRSNDYAGQIEALNSDNLEFARMGAGTYALGRKVMGDGLIAVACDENMDGTHGYHSVIVVRADSPYHTIDDLRGKTLAYADPNSTSGYVAPVYYLTKQGKPPATFFRKTVFGGSHELEIIALVNGTFDAAADDWYSDTVSNVLRMEQKGLIPKNSTRIVWKSPLIPNPPYVVRTNLPDDLKKDYVAALLALPTEAPAAYQMMMNKNGRAIIPMKHADYQEVIDMTLHIAKERKSDD